MDESRRHDALREASDLGVTPGRIQRTRAKVLEERRDGRSANAARRGMGTRARGDLVVLRPRFTDIQSRYLYLWQLERSRERSRPDELVLLEQGERVAVWPRPVGRARVLRRKTYKPVVPRAKAKKTADAPRSGVVVLSDHDLMARLGIQPIGWLE